MNKFPEFKKVFRRSIPNFLYSLIPRIKRVSPVPLKCSSILFLRPGKLGDMIVATSLFHALRKEIPGIKIAVACSPYNQVMVSNSPDIDIIKPVQFHSLFKVFDLIRWIRRSGFDWVVDLTPGISRTSTLISIFSRSQKTFTAGIQKEQFATYFDLNVDPGKVHIIEMYRKFLEKVLRLEFKSDFRPKVYIPAESEKKALRFFSAKSSTPFIGINLSAGIWYRQWNRTNYDTLFSLLKNEFNSSEIIVFSVGEQKCWAEDFNRKYGIRVVPPQDILTISAMISRLSLLFTPDTSFVHIASAFNVPVVALYHDESGNVLRWKGYSISSKELVSPDVNNIKPETAFSAIIEMADLPEEKRS